MELLLFGSSASLLYMKDIIFDICFVETFEASL